MTPIMDECLGAPMLYPRAPRVSQKVPTNSHAEVSMPNMPCLGVLAPSSVLMNTIYPSPAPLYHAAPLHYNLMVLGLGGTSLIMESFDPEYSLQLVERYK